MVPVVGVYDVALQLEVLALPDGVVARAGLLEHGRAGHVAGDHVHAPLALNRAVGIAGNTLVRAGVVGSK